MIIRYRLPYIVIPPLSTFQRPSLSRNSKSSPRITNSTYIQSYARFQDLSLFVSTLSNKTRRRPSRRITSFRRSVRRLYRKASQELHLQLLIRIGNSVRQEERSIVSERVAYRNFWCFYSVELFQLPPSLTTFASFSAIDAKMRKTAKIYENCRASPPGRILIKFSVSSLVDCTEQQFCTKATLLPLPLTIHSLCVGRSATRPSKSLYPIEGRIGPFRAAGYPVALHHIASRRLIERPKQIRLLRRNKSPQDTRKS